MTQAEGDDPLLDHHRQLVGHLGPAALARAQHLQAVAIDLGLPAVVGRAMHAHQAARLRDPTLGGQREQLQPIAEQHVILGHAACAPFTWR